ncbi:MAG: hypothetical protein JSW03_06850 [Candidatus Eiseniibacteriota bacterium]|nr:MAG: hypothetical protein JSW03_06850 [Candidatus Eisenbacteria bacterium]
MPTYSGRTRFMMLAGRLGLAVAVSWFCLCLSPGPVRALVNELELPDISAFAIGTDVNIRSVLKVDADSFNLQLRAAQDREEEWTESFVLVGLKLVGARFPGSRQKVYVQVEPSEWEPGRKLKWVRVTVEDEGWLDDSQFGERYVIWLVPDEDNRLAVQRALRARLCWRAYWKFYSAELCP